MADGAQFPPTLLPEVYWRFWEEDPFDDRSSFAARVTEYGRDISESFSWDPDSVAIQTPRVRVKYFGADPEDESEYADYEAVLESADGRTFTNGELLFSLHNAVVQHLRNVDHSYFEGLALVETSDADEPVYELQQGS